MSHDSDEAAARELKLCTENDGNIYRSQTQAILKNLATKKAQGTYDREKAVKRFMYLAETGARKYASEQGSSETEWSKMFPIKVRRAVARAWRDEFEDEYTSGSYEELKPKKYQKPTSGPNADLYQLGAAHGRHVADNLPSRSAFDYILGWKAVFPHARHHIPEIAHLPTPRESSKAAFKRGFLDQILASRVEKYGS